MPQQIRTIDPIMPLFNGKVTEILLPSGRKVKIRETNGDDEDVLSSINAAADGSNTYNFLSSISLEDSITKQKPSPDEIKEWPINDKYGLLFKQRIFNHGYDLVFRANCTEPKCEHEATYNENLKKWDADLSKEIDLDKPTIKPYPLGLDKYSEFTLSSGKKLKYSILNGVLEKEALELKDATKNSPLIVRHLSIENKGEWIEIKHFAGFSSREMAEIRSNIRKNDSQFDPIVRFTCSNPMCKKEYAIPLFTMGAFFYPEEMI